MSKITIPKAPDGLGPDGKRQWRRVLQEFSLEEWQLSVLAQACRCLDTAAAAEKVLAAEGVVVRDKFDQLKANPAAAVLRDARSGFLQATKSLGLDLEPVKGIGRPSRGY